MKLILEKDVKNLGKTGDTVSVKPGYARNYLLPQKLAITSTASHFKEWKHKKHLIEIRKKNAVKEREKTIAHLKNIHLVFEKEARSGGQLFGSLSPVEISKALAEKHNLSVDKRDIFFEPIKTTGKHKVKVALDSERETFLLLTIKQKKVAGKKEGSPDLDDHFVSLVATVGNKIPKQKEESSSLDAAGSPAKVSSESVSSEKTEETSSLDASDSPKKANSESLSSEKKESLKDS